MLYKKPILILITFFAGIFILFFTLDLFVKNNAPKFYTAPGFFCNGEYSGITLPPAGIFLCSNEFENEKLRAHELVHWEQYQRSSSIGFYMRYVWGWSNAGFDYEDNPMEIEAREKVRELL